MKKSKLLIVLLACVLAFSFVSCKDEPKTHPELVLITSECLETAEMAYGFMQAMFYQAIGVLFDEDLSACDPSTHIYSITTAGETAGYTLDNSTVATDGEYLLTIPATPGNPAAEVILVKTEEPMDYISKAEFTVQVSDWDAELTANVVNGEDVEYNFRCGEVTIEENTIDSCTVKDRMLGISQERVEIKVTQGAYVIEVTLMYNEGDLSIEKATVNGTDIAAELDTF